MRMTSAHRKKPVNVTIDASLVAEARSYGIALSPIMERAVRDAVKAERERRWAEENHAAIESHNEMIRREGLWTDTIPGWWNNDTPTR
jgi:antitoxin CcdA